MKKENFKKDICIFLATICIGFGFVVANYTYKKNLEIEKARIEIEKNKKEEKKVKEIKIEQIPKGIADSETIEYIKEFQNRVKNDERYNEVIKNAEKYPKDILKLLYNNKETLDFVLSKSDLKMPGILVKIDQECGNGVIPRLQQWDPKWGWAEYGDNFIALNGCGPTSLSMVLTGLTGDEGINPIKIANYSDSHGLHEKAGTNWELMTEYPEKCGVKGWRISNSKEEFENMLNRGYPIICSVSKGYFTEEGHFIVIAGMKDGKLIIHDPNSIEKSKKLWEYNDIKEQIKAAWAYSLE